jgi:hypothetical protein
MVIKVYSGCKPSIYHSVVDNLSILKFIDFSLRMKVSDEMSFRVDDLMRVNICRQVHETLIEEKDEY